MNKLLPPKIPATLPAFQGNIIKIFIEMNQAVGAEEISGFQCLLKTALSNTKLGTLESSQYEIKDNIVTIIFKNYDSSLNQKKIALLLGNFYKIQIAYIGIDGTIGIFSNVGIIKYCYPASVQIQNFEDNTINSFSGQFTGVYNSEDANEKVYSYIYNIYDEQKNLLDSSEEQIHNTSKDTDSFMSNSYFKTSINLKQDLIYYIQYSVITTNNLQLSTPLYKVMRKQTLPSELQGDLIPKSNDDNGCIELYFMQNQESLKKVSQMITGAFVITRLNMATEQWDEIYKFNLYCETPFKLIFKDYTTEQGVDYLYAIQQYNDIGLYSNKIFAKYPVQVNFEDMFLFDGNKQLRIQYNPKMSSFKQIVLEQKVNTIGGKYPFIFRNGNVGYKEFPISGLLSYKEDEAETFVKWDESFKENPYDTNLTYENITLERKFKLAVLEWLTNGKPKLFRSATEGNYVVRLLNVSLSPEDKLGRMIHTFSCTASEVAPYSYESLKALHLSGQENDNKKDALMQQSISLQTISDSGIVEYKTGPLIKDTQTITSFSISGIQPGSIITLIEDNHPVEIAIGSTGIYRADNVSISQVIIPEGAQYQGTITYSYKEAVKNKFSLIKDIFIHYVPARQFSHSEEIIQQINNNVKNKLLKFYQIRFYKKIDDVAINPVDYEKYTIDLEYDNTINKKLNILDKQENYVLKNVNNLTKIKIGENVLAEVSYSIQEIEYSLESEDQELFQLKEQYKNLKQIYQKTILDFNKSEQDDAIAYTNYNNSYTAFIQALTQKLNQYQQRA